MGPVIRTPIQKRFADFDAFRHANNIAQQMYFDVGKSDYFDRLLGNGLLFGRVRPITASTHTDYLGQVRFGDELEVVTSLERLGTKSLTLLQQLVGGDGAVRSESRSVMVAFDFDAQQSVEVPEAWRRAMTQE